jgi:hypothetical protein
MNGAKSTPISQLPTFPAEVPQQAPQFAAPPQAPQFSAPPQAPQFSAPPQAPQFSAPPQAPQFAAPQQSPQFAAPLQSPQFAAPQQAPQFAAPQQFADDDVDVDDTLKHLSGAYSSGASQVQQPAIYDTTYMATDSDGNPGGLTWAELARAALLVVILYVVVESLPLLPLAARFAPWLAGAPYGMTLFKAALLASAYVAIVKFV